MLEKSTFVFVHSAWLGAWSFGGLEEELRKLGHKSISVDLPAHGENKADPAKVSLKDYVETVMASINSQEEKVILVGHSFGGVTISQVAEQIPEKVKSLVYLSAFMLPSGVSFMKAIEGVTNSDVLNNLVFSDDGATVGIKEDQLHNAVAHDVPLEDFLKVKPMFVPEPTAPLKDELVLGDNYEEIDRYYIESTQDHAIPIEVQRAMQKGLPVKKVYSLDTSHSAIFSNPSGVISALIEVSLR